MGTRNVDIVFLRASGIREDYFCLLAALQFFFGVAFFVTFFDFSGSIWGLDGGGGTDSYSGSDIRVYPADVLHGHGRNYAGTKMGRGVPGGLCAAGLGGTSGVHLWRRLWCLAAAHGGIFVGADPHGLGDRLGGRA